MTLIIIIISITNYPRVVSPDNNTSVVWLFLNNLYSSVNWSEIMKPVCCFKFTLSNEAGVWQNKITVIWVEFIYVTCSHWKSDHVQLYNFIYFPSVEKIKSRYFSYQMGCTLQIVDSKQNICRWRMFLISSCLLKGKHSN